MQRFTDLKVWQRSHELVLKVYRLSHQFPDDERYGVTSQLRRAAVSVACNISEGSKRQYPKDYARFLNIAEASLSETEYLLILSQDLGYVRSESGESLRREIEEISRMLNALRVRVESDQPP
ncbi:MAG: four helix bundle protein [Holophagae bacterium]|jgi:four helix bundle protein